MSFEFCEKVRSLSAEAERELAGVFEKIDRIAFLNQKKTLEAFVKSRVSEAHFAATTGYGYGDVGRDALDEIYARVFGAEDALVRHNIVSGTHALTVALFAVLRPGDTLLAVTGKPYDTLDGVISGDSGGSLKEFGVSFSQVELKDGEIDFDGVKAGLKRGAKAALIQRSMGYDWRRALTVGDIGELIAFIKKESPDCVCVVDNCYGEFTQEKEPCEVGADMTVGSLIKNAGGSLAQSGGYIAGKRGCVSLAAQRHTAPGIGRECGASLGQSRLMYQGFFIAPHVTAQALKAAAFCGALMEKLGFAVFPKPLADRSDIIQAVRFDDEKKLIAFCRAIQSASPVDSFVSPEPWEMPGYSHKVIMAAGGFVAGSSIELSADAPIKEPYIAYMQGGITYESAKIALMTAAERIISG